MEIHEATAAFSRARPCASSLSMRPQANNIMTAANRIQAVIGC
jgi:hypothetical protein